MGGGAIHSPCGCRAKTRRLISTAFLEAEDDPTKPQVSNRRGTNNAHWHFNEFCLPVQAEQEFRFLVDMSRGPAHRVTWPHPAICTPSPLPCKQMSRKSLLLLSGLIAENIAARNKRVNLEAGVFP